MCVSLGYSAPIMSPALAHFALTAALAWTGAWSAPAVQPGQLAAVVPAHDGTGGLTVRDVVHLTLGGSRVRVRLTNVFGDRPARFTDVRLAVARPGGTIQSGTGRRLWFGGRTSVTIAPGRELPSDAVTMNVRAGEDLAISLYAPAATGTPTIEGSLNHTNYLSAPGDAAGASSGSAYTTTSKAWYWVSGVDVQSHLRAAGAVVALGASITAGYASSPDANRDWADLLAARLHRAGHALSVLNEGIAGNNIHEDTACYGQSALHRLDRDALRQPGVRAVIIDEGDNDITHPSEPASTPLYGCLAHHRIDAAGMIALLTQAARRIHAIHLRAIGATLSPFGRYAHWSQAIEAERQQINRWMRTTTVFDGVIDFDRALSDPAHPAWLTPSYDSGDGLHPNDRGHRAMADAVDLSIFAPPSRLPAGFIWGVSSSGFQSEGHTTGANWNFYIRRDSGPHPVGSAKEPYGNSVDFYDRYRSDIALAAGLGVNTYRISINWSRVEPRRGVFSEAGLRFYDRVFARMAHFHIRPLITLNHWDYPMWVYRQGGWANRRTVDDFARLTTVIAKRYGRLVRYWLTFNEAFFYEYIEKGNDPLTDAQARAMLSNLISAHKRAYVIVHRFSPGAMVSSNYAWPGRGSLASLETDPFLQAVRKQLDYVALDYYYPAYNQLVSLGQLSAGTSWNIPLDPFGMYTALRSMHRDFPHLPVLITENGMPTHDAAPRADGVTRAENLRDTLYWVQRARQDGVPVIGYMYWSLTDNYEWGSYGARFGLYTVNIRSDPRLVRHPTAAVVTYRRAIAARGVPTGFRPTERPTLADCATEAVAPPDRAACRAAAG